MTALPDSEAQTSFALERLVAARTRWRMASATAPASMMAPSTIASGGHRLDAERRHAEAFAGRLQLHRLDCARSDVESDNRLRFAKHAKLTRSRNACYSRPDYGRNACARPQRSVPAIPAHPAWRVALIAVFHPADDKTVRKSHFCSSRYPSTTDEVVIGRICRGNTNPLAVSRLLAASARPDRHDDTGCHGRSAAGIADQEVGRF